MVPRAWSPDGYHGRVEERALLAVCVLAGCGRFGFDSHVGAGAIDGRTNGADGVVAMSDGTTTATGPFGPATPLVGVNDSGDDVDGGLSSDELELLWTSSRSGNAEIWRARRTAIGAAWSSPALATELDGTSVESDPEISVDGLTVLFTSQRPPSGLGDIWIATRTTIASPFGPPVRVPDLSTAANECCAVMTTDELNVVFAGVPSSDAELFSSSRATQASPWGSRALIGELDTTSQESNPYLTPDGLTVYFDSDRPGGAGGRDLYVATRPAVTAAFSAPTRISELATSSDERDAWLSPDGHRLYFSSNRNGNFDLYVAER
jgi:hypothetical protein